MAVAAKWSPNLPDNRISLPDPSIQVPIKFTLASRQFPPRKSRDTQLFRLFALSNSSHCSLSSHSRKPRVRTSFGRST